MSKRTFFNFGPFSDEELAGFSEEQLAIELQFMRATAAVCATLAGEWPLRLVPVPPAMNRAYEVVL